MIIGRFFVPIAESRAVRIFSTRSAASHKEDLLALVIRRPLQDTCIECENSGKCEMEQNRDAFVCPKRRPHYRAYCIPKDEVRQQLAALEKEFGNSLD